MASIFLAALGPQQRLYFFPEPQGRDFVSQVVENAGWVVSKSVEGGWLGGGLQWIRGKRVISQCHFGPIEKLNVPVLSKQYPQIGYVEVS